MTKFIIYIFFCYSFSILGQTWQQDPFAIVSSLESYGTTSPKSEPWDLSEVIPVLKNTKDKSLLEVLLSQPKLDFQSLQKIDGNSPQSIEMALNNQALLVGIHLVYEDLPQSGNILEPKSSFVGAKPILIHSLDRKNRILKISFGENQPTHNIGISLFQKYTTSLYALTKGGRSSLLTESQVVQKLKGLAESRIHPPAAVFAIDGEKGIQLAWEEVPGSIGYEIFRRRTFEKNSISVGITRKSFFLDLGAKKNQAYKYQIKALFENGISEASRDTEEIFYRGDKSKTELLIGFHATALSDRRITFSWLGGLAQISKWNPTTESFRMVSKGESGKIQDILDRERISVYRLSADGKIHSGLLFISPEFGLDPKSPRLKASEGRFQSKVSLEWEAVSGATHYVLYKSIEGKGFEKLIETKETKFDDSKEPLVSNQYTVIAKVKGLFTPPLEVVDGFASILAKRDIGKAKTPHSIQLLPKAGDKDLSLRWKADSSKEIKVFLRKLGVKKWTEWKTISGRESEIELEAPKDRGIYALSLQGIDDVLPDSDLSEPIYFVSDSIVYDTKATRSFNESPVAKYLGPWTAMVWDGKGAVKPVKLEIDGDPVAMEVILKWNQTSPSKANYVPDSASLESTGKWKIRISEDGEALSAEITDRRILPEKTQISFVRE